MPRKGRATRRKVAADPKYGDYLVGKFINSLMYHGKKSKAEAILYGALDKIKDETGKDSLEFFHEAVDNIKPNVEVRPRRVGGATYQVPMEVSSHRKQSLALRWLINATRSRSERSMVEKLYAELTDAVNNRGGAIKKKEDTHRMADANRAFAHYRW